MNCFLRKIFFLCLNLICFDFILKAAEIRDPFRITDQEESVEFSDLGEERIYLSATVQCGDKYEAVITKGEVSALVAEGSYIWGYQVKKVYENKVSLIKPDGTELLFII